MTGTAMAVINAITNMIMRFIVAPWVFFRGATEASYTDMIGIRSTAFIRCSSTKRMHD
ncbi:protein of unknown function [Hyphomicrobium sp. MC1]|nr:protein of unknown function [Hyphomicrobium sp. MC1]